MSILNPANAVVVVIVVLLLALAYSIADRLGITASIKRIAAAWRSGRRYLGKDRP